MSVLARDEDAVVQLTFNGTARTCRAQPNVLLVDFVRTELGSTGTQVGCENGTCGACTVRVDGIAQRACLTLAVQIDGRAVQTVEGLFDDGALGELQSAFKRHFALHCGFCAAGILMSCADWLEHLRPGQAVGKEQVLDMLGGHLCRCASCEPIVEAVLEVANARQGNDQADRSSPSGAAPGS